MIARQDVVEDGKPGKQPDILESPGNTGFGRVNDVLFLQVHAVKEDLPPGRLVDFCQHIEDRCLACAVRPDKAGDLAFIDLHVQIVDRGQASEINAEALYIKDHFPVRHFTPPPSCLPRVPRQTCCAGFWSSSSLSRYS